jgi:predicted metal-binding protein
MEAVGIDVVATAEAAGLVIELPADEHPAWTGLVLID